MRRTSVYTLIVEDAPEGLLDTMAQRVTEYATLVGSIPRKNGQAVLRFRCETSDIAALDIAAVLLPADVKATLTIDLGVHKRTIGRN